MGEYFRLVNITKRQYVEPTELGDDPKITAFGNSADGTMFALALLLAKGEGGGGWGEIDSDNEMVGSWAGDKIVIAGQYRKAWEDVPVGDRKALYGKCIEINIELSKVKNSQQSAMTAKELAKDADNDCNLYRWADFFCKNITKDIQAVIVAEPDVRAKQKHEWQVPSETSVGVVYTVTKDEAEWTCTCPDFQRRGHIRPCKHIKSVQDSYYAERATRTKVVPDMVILIGSR